MLTFARKSGPQHVRAMSELVRLLSGQSVTGFRSSHVAFRNVSLVTAQDTLPYDPCHESLVSIKATQWCPKFQVRHSYLDVASHQKTASYDSLESIHRVFPLSNHDLMSNRPDRRRLTTWEQQPMPQPRTQHRWSTPTVPIASLVQPGYTSLGTRPPRPLRAPVYPLSSRPFLSQQTSTQRILSYQISPDQNPPQQNSTRDISTQQTSNQNTPPRDTSRPRPRRWKRLRRLSRLFRLSRHDHTPAQTSPPTSPSPPSIISHPTSPRGAPVVLETPRPAPLPPQNFPQPSLPPPPLPPPLPDDILPDLPSFPSHAPANRRPLSIPAPLYGADPVADDRHSLPSLQHNRFVLCQGCSRIRHCMIGGGRVLCTECLRQHFIDRQD